jgi:hypothetical protein
MPKYYSALDAGLTVIYISGVTNPARLRPALEQMKLCENDETLSHSRIRPGDWCVLLPKNTTRRSCGSMAKRLHQQSPLDCGSEGHACAGSGASVRNHRKRRSCRQVCYEWMAQMPSGRRIHAEPNWDEPGLHHPRPLLNTMKPDLSCSGRANCARVQIRISLAACH